MAYNNRNKLLQMQTIIEVYLAHKTADTTFSKVHKTVIFPMYHISRSTLYNYLNTPVKKLLKELDAKKEAKKSADNQKTLNLFSN